MIILAQYFDFWNELKQSDRFERHLCVYSNQKLETKMLIIRILIENNSILVSFTSSFSSVQLLDPTTFQALPLLSTLSPLHLL